MSSKTVITGPSIAESTPVHVAYSPFAAMNHQWTINLHDEYPPPPPLYALMPGESIPPSLLHHCNLMSSMLLFGVDYLHPTKEPQHDLPSLAPPKGEMSSFQLDYLFKSPTPRTLHLGDPTLAKLNQVISAPKDIFTEYLLTKLLSMCETEFYATKSILFF